MNVGSLFSGIGGFDLGFERAGMRTSWFCEQDDYCRKVLNRHWPGVPVYPDVTKLKGADVEPVDLLCGGFPCQDISTAGRGAGIRGERSGLWSEFARLIGELEPGWVVVENVSALLGRGLSVVLADLSALGYNAEWDCVPASAVGAPHRRDRIWIVAYPCGESGGMAEHRGGRQGRESADSSESALVRQEDRASGPEGFAACDRTGNVADAQGIPEREPANETDPVSVGREAWNESVNGCELGGTGFIPDPDRSGRQERRGAEPVRAELAAAQCVREEMADASRYAKEGAGTPAGTIGERTGQGGQPGRGRFPDSVPWATEPDVGRVADGVPARVDRLSALGNALVPQIPEWIGHRIMSFESAQGKNQ